MRVAIHVVGLPSFRQGGAGMYALSLIEGLSEASGVDPVVLCDRGPAAELEHLAGTVELRVADRSRPAAPVKALELVRALRDPRRYADGYRVSTEMLAGCQLVHYPLSFMTAPVHRLPTVLTSVDLQHRRFPRFFSPGDRVLRRVRWDRSLAVADQVIAISEFTRQEVLRSGLAPAERVHVIHLACDRSFFEPVPGRAPGRFFFYPASPLPAKNHGRLLDAFAKVAERHPGVRLVLSGPALHDWAPVRRAIAERRLEAVVEVEGTLERDGLRDRYASAIALVFPSLYEGFGLPLVEAMASGCVVVASTAGSIPEVAGPDALLFDPQDPAEIEAAMERALALGPDERDRITSAARERARGFTADRMVERTLEVYDRARGSGLAGERRRATAPGRPAA